MCCRWTSAADDAESCPSAANLSCRLRQAKGRWVAGPPSPVCSQGCAWSPAFLQGLSTYFLLKTKYTKSPPGTEWNSGLCPFPSEHIWEPFAHRAEQLHSERGREGEGWRVPCSAMEESEGWNRNWIQGWCGGWLYPEDVQREMGQDHGELTGSDDSQDFRLSISFLKTSHSEVSVGVEVAYFNE